MWGLIARGVMQLLRLFARGGGAARTVAVSRYGQITFVGLIRNRPLHSLTQQEIRNAFAKVGLREAHNSHFISRLVQRGPQFGIQTLGDFARVINNGVMRAGRQANTVEIVAPNGRVAIVVNRLGELVTLLPL
jgi:hypothetical protein